MRTQRWGRRDEEPHASHGEMRRQIRWGGRWDEEEEEMRTLTILSKLMTWGTHRRRRAPSPSSASPSSPTHTPLVSGRAETHERRETREERWVDMDGKAWWETARARERERERERGDLEGGVIEMF
jgi:hypothetical protein